MSMTYEQYIELREALERVKETFTQGMDTLMDSLKKIGDEIIIK